MARTYQFDVDTKRYLNRVNAYRFANGLTDIAKSDAVDIDNFVIGLKDLGVWPTSTFWMLRSQYSIGTGLIAPYCGGGFCNCDANLIGSQSWTNKGIIKDQSTKYITASVRSQGGNLSRTIIAIAGEVSSQNTVLSYGSINVIRFSLRFNTSTSVQADTFNYNDAFGATTIPNLSYNQVALTYNTNTKSLVFKLNNSNTTTATTQLQFPQSTTVTFGGWDSSFINTGLGTHTFGLISDQPFSSSTIDSIYNLQKSTIGKGLGLV